MFTDTDFKFVKWEDFWLSGDFLICLASLNIINWYDKNPILNSIREQMWNTEITPTATL
jgi:hypothetical protein